MMRRMSGRPVAEITELAQDESTAAWRSRIDQRDPIFVEQCEHLTGVRAKLIHILFDLQWTDWQGWTDG